MLSERKVTVPLGDDLREFVVRRAAAEVRTMASVIRRLVAEAARAETVSEGGRHDRIRTDDGAAGD